MLERLTGTLLVALDEPAADAETQQARWALVAGRRCVARGEGPAVRLASLGGLEIRASFFDRAAHFERLVTQSRERRLAEVFARRHIDGQMLFNESYRLRTKLIPLGEADVVVRALAVPELACSRAFDALPLTRRPVRLVTLEEAAIAALAAQATREPLLVCHQRGTRFVAFLCEAGELRSRQLEYVAQGDVVAQAEAVERAAAQFAGSDSPQPVAQLLFGELRALCRQDRFQREVAARELEKKLAGLVQGADALAEPELFGLPFVPQPWNLLDATHAQSALAWKLALPTAAVLLAGAALAATLASFQSIDNTARENQLAQRRATLQQELAELGKRLPDAKETGQLAEFTALLQKRSEQVRVDYFLAWLTPRIPDGSTLQSLVLYAQGDTPPQAAQASDAGPGATDLLGRLFGRDQAAKAPEQPTKRTEAPKPQPGRYVADLILNLPGSYEHVEHEAGRLIGLLAERLTFDRALLDYDAAQRRARLVLRASFAGKDFVQ